jgi:probable phosphoglycerate mutase
MSSHAAAQAAWPARLVLVRHGESAGNVARDAAEAGGLAMIDVAQRDMDVALSDRGREQAAAVGRWLIAVDDGTRPAHSISSPYVRAQDTARLALDAAGCDEVTVRIDERLREREFGILDRLTKRGIEDRFPEQAAARALVGKFYHRPPGGESWCDVALRLRSFIDTLGREYAGESVMVVTHQVVILMFRYLLEELTEQEILAIDRQAEVANCSVTVYELDDTRGPHGGMRRVLYNCIDHLAAPRLVTAEPDAPVAPR